jgi:predicted MFS family arabinose efflux permease
VSICLLFFGTGSIIGGYLSGYTCDKYSIKNTGYLANIFIILTCLIEVYFLSVASSVSGASITGFFAGLSYSFIFSYVMVVCTVHFKGSASSFATIRFVNVIFYISYQWFAVIQNNAANMNYNMIIQSIIFIPISILASYCIKI